MNDLINWRQEYTLSALLEKEMLGNPLEQFELWITQAKDFGVVEPNAMAVASVSAEGKPSVRVVLLKEVQPRGFVFFTNYLSKKGQDIAQNPWVSVLFDWHEMERQVRIEGKASKLTAKESDAYFDSRPLASQIGAWASPQSTVVDSREQLDQLYQAAEEQAMNRTLVRPPHWGGYLIEPTKIEFWQGRPGRMHDRLVYQLTQEQWQLHRLAP